MCGVRGCGRARVFFEGMTLYATSARACRRGEGGIPRGRAVGVDLCEASDLCRLEGLVDKGLLRL